MLFFIQDEHYLEGDFAACLLATPLPRQTTPSFLPFSSSNMSTTATMDLYDKMAETSRAFVMSHLDAYRAQDTSILSRDLTPNAHRRVGPATFEQRFKPQGWSNAEYEETLKPKFRAFKDMKLEINDVTVDTKKRRATVHSSHVWIQSTKGDMWDWPMEFIWILDLTEEGDKVTKILEFVDTHNAMTYGGKLKSGEVDGHH